MSPKFEERLLKYLDSLEGGIKSLIDFSVEQSPLVVQELITYTIVYNVAVAAISVILAIALAIVSHKVSRWEVIASGDGFPTFVVWVVSGTVMLAVLLPLAFRSIAIVLKAWLAPRLFVLEYLRDLAS